MFHTRVLSSRTKNWLLLGATAALLGACGGGSSSDVADHKTASMAQTGSTEASPNGDSTAFAKSAELSHAELAAAEQQAQATEASPSTTPLEQLQTGEIAAKGEYKSGAVARKAAAVRIPVYRFYNGSTGAHFFTTNTAERDNVVENLSPPFSLEGPAFSVASAFSPGLSPVHRFYNTQSGVHFYTISESERANVVANFPQFSYEGVAYHASQVAGTGFIPFYRFYVPSKGFHFYTANEEEKNSIIAKLAAVYSYEGIGYHVLDSKWRAEKLPHTGLFNDQCFEPGSNALVSCSKPEVMALNAQQDGHRFTINPMSYSPVGSHPFTECVKDNITGLIWEGKELSGMRANNKRYTHLSNGESNDISGYVVAVNAQSLCGFNDWRMPTRQELQSILVYGRNTPPMVYPTWFPNTASWEYWSAELDSVDNTQAWFVSFEYGGTSQYERTASNRVRLVRGNSPSGPRFTYSTVAYGGDAANNAVNDAWTGLQWRRCEEGEVWSSNTCSGTRPPFRHQEALIHAENRSGWRLPNVKELSSLVDLSVSSGARINLTAFPGAATGSGWVWTSSPHVTDLVFAWAVNFNQGGLNGGFYGYPRSSTFVGVRLVRAIQ